MKLKISVLTTIMFLFGAVATQAQQLNVIQVKGNRAIVEVQTGEKLKVGESYAVGKVDGEVSLDPVAAGKGSRNYLVGLDFILSNTKPDTANSKSTLLIDTTMKFGWNKKQYEYGPLAEFTYAKEGTTSTSTTWGLGAFGTYNFQPNIIGTDLILSGDIDFRYSKTTQEVSTVKSNSSTMEMNVGPFVKWYGISDDHCLRGGLVFHWDKLSPGSGSSVATTGVAAVVGISTYF